MRRPEVNARWPGSRAAALARWIPLLCLIAWLCVPTPGRGETTAAASAAPLVLPASARMVSLNGRLALFYDAANQTRIETLAAAPPAADPFQPLPHSLGLGYRAGSAWLRFTLRRPADTPAEWWLEVSRAALDEVVLYRPGADGGWAGQALGDHYPWADRAVRMPKSVFVLDIPSGGPVTYYLRLRSTSSLGASLRLWRPAAFAEANAMQMALVGGFALTALVIVLISLVQAWALRDRLHLIYAGYVLCLTAYLLLVEGVVHVLLSSPHAIRLEPLISLVHPAIIALMALLTRDLLQLARFAPRLDRLYRTLAWVVPLVGALAVVGGVDAALKPWLWRLLYAELVLNAVLAIWLSWRGLRSARLYLMAFGVLIASTLWGLKSVLGLNGGREWTYDLTMLGSLIHMVLMQLTITDRVQTAKRSHDRARERALRAEQLATTRLDEEVTRRTAALHRTLAELESTHTRLAASLQVQTEIAGQLAAAKETAERALIGSRTLTAMMSHEFRTPLAVIDAAAQVLQVRYSGDPAIQTLVARILRGSGRARHFVDNCLIGERISEDRLALHPQPVDLPRLAHAALEGAELTAGPGRLRLCCPATLPPLAGDPELLAILLHNLLQNAIKYSPAAAPVTLTVAVEAGEARLRVADQGSGIPAAEQALVFEKYRRGRESSAIPGAGLGLALVARICELHQGRIALASEPGCGTCITITLPLQPPPASPP